jgi:hypothetical protein
MFRGIGTERGHYVQSYDAFGVACHQCLNGNKEEQETFMEIMQDSEDIKEFSKRLIEWYFSSDWVEEEDTIERGNYY